MPCLRHCPHPFLRLSYAVWMGAIATPEEVRARYAVDEVGFVDGMAATLGELGAPYLHTLDDFVNTDSGRRQAAVAFPGIEGFRVDGRTAWPVLCDCRVVRSVAWWLRMDGGCAWRSGVQPSAAAAAAAGNREWEFPAARRGLSVSPLVDCHLKQ